MSFIVRVVVTITMVVSAGSAEAAIFQDMFDTASTRNRSIYDTRFVDHKVKSGALVIFYSSLLNSPPSGIECAFPPADRDPVEREIGVSFLGGGMEMSNSLDIAYAVGKGEGLCIAPVHQNFSASDRTGYILRYLRHGDGTNEIQLYRSDTGWTKMIGREWVDFNPITTLKRSVIRHSSFGEHTIVSEFDTGLLIVHKFEIDDSSYPPNNAQRGFQLILSGYGQSQSSEPACVITDSWIVQDVYRHTPRQSMARASISVFSSPRGGGRYNMLIFPTHCVCMAAATRIRRNGYASRSYRKFLGTPARSIF